MLALNTTAARVTASVIVGTTVQSLDMAAGPYLRFEGTGLTLTVLEQSLSANVAIERVTALDPVTGSAHCTLVPYWSKRLGKTRLFARQVSARGGELWCEDRGERVSIAGRCVKYLEGTIELPGA